MYGAPAETDLVGELYLAASPQPSLADYNSSLLQVMPALRASEWTGACSGYYVSSVDGGRLRLAYFVPTEEPIEALEWIRSQSGLRDAKGAVAPREVDYTINYGDAADARFRRWLCMYTQVVLDLRESDWLRAQRLAATYRFEASWTRNPAQQHLETALSQASRTYASWSDQERDFLWASFDHWAGPNYTDWGHFFVNAVLAYDWRHPFGPSFPPSPGRAEVNQILAACGHNFDVPPDWKPVEQSD